PPEIIRRWREAAKDHNADVLLVELGGTVGEYEGLLFFEAVRRLKLRNPHSVCLVHVGYLPVPRSIGELKSKPLQQSISLLNSLGLQPDIIIARAEKMVDKKRKEKIALASGLSIDDIVSNPDVASIYEVPLVLDKQSLTIKILKKLKLKRRRKDLRDWKHLVDSHKKLNKKVTIGMVGKYQKTGDYTLKDSYVCVVEALKHAAVGFGVSPKIVWLDSEKIGNMGKSEFEKVFKKLDAIIVPQGWGKRGAEGKIRAIKYARENKIPYLGLCFGMQMAAIEFARNVMGMNGADTTEVNKRTKHPVIHIMPKQKEYLEKRQYGGTIRLGAWPCIIKRGTKLEKAYKRYGKGRNKPWFTPNPFTGHRTPVTEHRTLAFERHRHRYEFNNKYRKKFEKEGLKISGTSPDGKLVEAIELKNHPFFVGTQFHPEYLSRPLTPHPIFVSFIEAIVNSN
ncbi:MAG: CTP synthase, partial [Patescibacteria group bacterium]